MLRRFTRPFLILVILIICLMVAGTSWVYGQSSPPTSNPSSPNSQTDSPDRALAPLGSAFTYQGELEDDNRSANGSYDFSFRLLDGPDPSLAGQIGSPVAVNDVTVENGIFTVQLDFGASPFTGEARWLEISVARAGETLTALTPTQPLTAVPYALFGEDADADPANELNSNLSFTGTTLQISDAGGTLSQDLGTFNGNLIITTNGRLGVRESSPITDLQINQSDGLIGGTGGLTLSRSTNWKIMHTGSHLSFVEDNVRRAYIETGTGNYVTVSDETQKKDVEPLGTVMADVLRLKPVEYRYNTQDEAAAMNYGFIAQDVAAIFPELTRTAEDGTLGLSYADFGVLAIASIQEQQAQIEALQRENAALRVEMNEIRGLLSQGSTSANGAVPATWRSAPATGGAATTDGPNLGSLFSLNGLGWLGLVLVGALLLRARRKGDRAG
jgi:hypothetical protein